MTTSLITAADRTFAVYDDEHFQATLEDLTTKIEVNAASQGTKWMIELTEFTSQINDLTQKTLMTEAAILSTVKRLWDAEKINPEIISEWDGNFWSWAKYVAQRGIDVPDKVTLQNRIAVYEYYFEKQNQDGGFALPPILVYEIDIKIEDGEVSTEEITIENPNLHHAAYSKLLSAKGLAVSNGGNLNDKTIAMMINSAVTIKEFKAQLVLDKNESKELAPSIPPTVYGDNYGNGEDSLVVKEDENQDTELEEGHYASNLTQTETDVDYVPSLATTELDTDALNDPRSQGVHYQDGVLYYFQDGVTVPAYVRATIDDGADHPLVEVGQNYILGRFGIYDADLEAKPDNVEGPFFMFNNDGQGVLTVNGYQFAVLDGDSVMALFKSLSEQIRQVEKYLEHSEASHEE